MPSIFKALASIVAWVLFVFGLLSLLIGFVRVFGAIPKTATAPSLPLITAYFGFGIISLTLSVVVMKLRQTF